MYNLNDEITKKRDRRIGESQYMALTRKMLKAMGIEDEKIDQIIDAHTETVDGLKAYKADAERLADVEKELETLKAKGDGGLKQKYDDLKAEYEKYKTEVENAKALEAKKTAYKELIKDAGLSEKGSEKALKYADWEKIELDSDGKIKDAKDHLKDLKEEWAEYVVKEGEKGAETATPPENNGSKMTKEEILKIKDTTARQRAMVENHELFGIK